MTKIFILSALLCCITLQADAGSDFKVKPYLYTIKGQAWALSWSYATPPEDQEKITVTLATPGSSISVGAKSNGLVYTAVLPLPPCGFENVTYQVTGQEAPIGINTIPCADDPRTTRLSFLADTQEGPQFAHIFSEQVAKFKGAAVLMGGDLVQTGTNPNEWAQFFEALNPAIQSQFLLPAVGNHEYRYNKKVPFWEGFFQTPATEEFYAVDVGPVHIIAMNSGFYDDPSLKVRELSFVQKELQKNYPWKVVFFHHPAYSRGFFNSPEAPRKEYVTLQRDYIPLFEQYHVDLVLNGHTHIYEHSIKAGIHYLTMGPAGGKMGTYGARNPYSLESTKKRTIAEIEVNQNTLRAVTVTIEGETLSEFTLHK